jgi:ferritin
MMRSSSSSSSSSSSFFLGALAVALGVQAVRWGEPSCSSMMMVTAFTICTPTTTATSSSSRLYAATSSSTSLSAAAAAAAADILMGPSKDLLDLFNNQVTQEFIASQTYLSASIWFDSNDWEGMAAYMLAESDDERLHGLTFVDFANKRNIPIELQNIPAPPSLSEWSTPENVWQSILELEQLNTRSLLNLAEAASNCHDYAALAFLNPFHMVQVNEEDKISGILAKVRGKFIM